MNVGQRLCIQVSLAVNVKAHCLTRGRINVFGIRLNGFCSPSSLSSSTFISQHTVTDVPPSSNYAALLLIRLDAGGRAIKGGDGGEERENGVFGLSDVAIPEHLHGGLTHFLLILTLATRRSESQAWASIGAEN